MSTPFIPLTLAGKSGTQANAPTFQRLAVLPQAQPAPPSVGTTPCAQHPATAPVVTLRRDGDHVTHIRIQCPCGQLIELECVY